MDRLQWSGADGVEITGPPSGAVAALLAFGERTCCRLLSPSPAPTKRRLLVAQFRVVSGHASNPDLPVAPFLGCVDAGGKAPLATSPPPSRRALTGAVWYAEARCASLSADAVAAAEGLVETAIAKSLVSVQPGGGGGDGGGAETSSEQAAAAAAPPAPSPLLLPGGPSYDPHRRLSELQRPEFRWSHWLVCHRACVAEVNKAGRVEAAEGETGEPGGPCAVPAALIRAPAAQARALARARALRRCAEDAERDAARRSLPLVAVAARELGVLAEQQGDQRARLMKADAAPTAATGGKERARAVYEATCCVRRWGELVAIRREAQRAEAAAGAALGSELARAEAVRDKLVARAAAASSSAAAAAGSS